MATNGRGTLLVDSTVQGFSPQEVTVTNPRETYMVFETDSGVGGNEPLPVMAPGTRITVERTATQLIYKWRLIGTTWQDLPGGEGVFAVASGLSVTASLQS